MTQLRTCKVCGATKPLAQFPLCGGGYRRRVCSPCFEKTPARMRRANHRKRGVKMTYADYLAFKATHSGRCDICGDRAQHLDHDHATGAVRGLLCSACNKGLGFFRDDPERLEAAIAYLNPEGSGRGTVSPRSSSEGATRT